MMKRRNLSSYYFYVTGFTCGERFRHRLHRFHKLL